MNSVETDSKTATQTDIVFHESDKPQPIDERILEFDTRIYNIFLRYDGVNTIQIEMSRLDSPTLGYSGEVDLSDKELHGVEDDKDLPDPIPFMNQLQKWFMGEDNHAFYISDDAGVNHTLTITHRRNKKSSDIVLEIQIREKLQKMDTNPENNNEVDDEETLPIHVEETNHLKPIKLGEPEEHLCETIYKLCIMPTQFTTGKTELTLDEMRHRRKDHVAQCPNHHLIEIVITNNSLQETRQWKIRTKNKFGSDTINIHVLSSASDSTVRYMDTFISKIVQENKSLDNLPNILIMCYHSKRVTQDLHDLIRLSQGTIITVNGKQLSIKFHISFDEPDANLGTTRKFLTKVKEVDTNNTVVGVSFITATPVVKFWDMLGKAGIHQLMNANHTLRGASCSEFKNFKEARDQYRSFEDHPQIHYDSETRNPEEYIKEVFSLKRVSSLRDDHSLEYSYRIDPALSGTEICAEPVMNSDRKIIFAPAHLRTETPGVGSHLEVAKHFTEMGYCVLVMNGKFTGFEYPDKTRISLDDFNAEHGIVGELRESLKKWNELNPTTNIAITGYWVIERGITFNTDGFNFTHMILSHYHLSSINKLVQIAGRATGNKKYVDEITIICPTEVYDAIRNFTKSVLDICELNPTHFNKSDFESLDKPIPVKIVIDDPVVLNELVEYRTKGAPRKKNIPPYNVDGFHARLQRAIYDKKCTVYDRNHLPNRQILTMDGRINRTLKTVRMYSNGDSEKDRRLKQMNDNFENYCSYAQSCEKTEYSIDFAKDIYIYNGFTNPTNVMWITYTC
jgi:hypothetical protein